MNTYFLTRNAGRTFARNPLLDLRREMDLLFDDSWNPSAEIAEEEDHYLLSFEIPGVAKDKLTIEVSDDVLTVSGESRRGHFQRTLSLPQGIDPNKAEAHYEDGVLQLFVPKAESSKPRRVPIGHSSTPGTGFFSKLLGKKEASPSNDKPTGHVA